MIQSFFAMCIMCISSASKFNILKANKVEGLVVLHKTYRPFSFMSAPNSIALVSTKNVSQFDWTPSSSSPIRKKIQDIFVSFLIPSLLPKMRKSQIFLVQILQIMVEFKVLANYCLLQPITILSNLMTAKVFYCRQYMRHTDYFHQCQANS